MTPEEAAVKVLDTMLGHLGFAATVEVQEGEEGPCLQIHTAQSEHLLGREGERLDDLQYLVNRVVRRHFPKAPRIRVDCEHFRSMSEDQLVKEVLGLAERVKASGKSFRMRPLNAYYRRIVHNALVDDPEVETHSPGGDERLKRIAIRPRGGGGDKEEAEKE
jgi:spoIIIJ-associated protein